VHDQLVTRGTAVSIVIEGDGDCLGALDSLHLQGKDRNVVDTTREINIVGTIVGASAGNGTSGTILDICVSLPIE
jgi:hypothetical protein